MAINKKVLSKAAHFQVDTRLAVLLGESYTSTERALKELIDNAWDADAENIWITLPEPMTPHPVIIQDDGTGMTEQELRSEYLFIANDRRSRKGERTALKQRKVKGRKGVGKFAGLCAASLMVVETRARGKKTGIVIDRKTLETAGKDIENVDLDVKVDASDSSEHGTTITLSELDQNLHFPAQEKLRPLLLREYGREEGISIYVNGKKLDLADTGGVVIQRDAQLAQAGPATLRVAIAEDRARIKGSGIVIRVKGKVVGRPTFLGLDEADDFPKSLLGQVYGEIEADGLEADITADFSAILENSKAYEQIKEWAAPLVREQVSAVFGREMQLAKARLQQKINRRLAALPEHRRSFAEDAMNKLLRKFYGENEDKLEPIVNVVFDALERDEYRLIIEEIDKARDSDVALFAQALENFGLVDLAVMAQQARQRLRFIDYLHTLSDASTTDEKVMHLALEQNLWVFGNDYGLLASNRQLKTIVESMLGKVYSGARATERPDLLLASNVSQQHTVIEFKAPRGKVAFDHYQQATKYRHELSSHISGTIDVLIVGGEIASDALPASREPNVKATTYTAVISNARIQLDWLLKQLASELSD